MANPMKGDSHVSRPFSLAVVAFCAAALIPTAAAAEPNCNETDRTHELLAKKFQETPIGAGVTSKGGLIELLTTRDGATWTIIISTPQGLSCLLASGEGWRSKDYAEPAGPGA